MTEEPAVRIAELSDGLRLPYMEQGDPLGTPVLFLHGITDSWRSFELALPHLPDSIRALVLTQRGHGDASRPASGYHPEDFAGDVVAFLDRLGIDRAVIVGHSMGSVIGQIVAARHPDRVLGLVLVAAFAGYRGKPHMHELVDAVMQLCDPVDPDFVREFQESTTARPVPSWFIDNAIAESLELPARVWHAVFGQMLELDPPALSSIVAPTLILWGDQDTFASRADQDALIAGLRHARLAVYERTGHALHWEEPERFAADVALFVRSIEAGVSGPHGAKKRASNAPTSAGASS
jgi:pimeloyl-ACP methyl ester carboxylesterase